MTPARATQAAVALAVTAAALTAPAWAAPGGVGGLALFDVTDSAGITVSQYQLSIDNGGTLGYLDGQAQLTLIVSLLWDLYRWWIAFLAYLVDWTAAMGWVGWIAGPVDTAATHLRDTLLQPVGATGFGQGGLITLLCLTAGLVGGLAVFRGRASGWLTMAAAAFVAALAVGALATPVTSVLGDADTPARPLLLAQRAGIELGNAITTGATTGPVDSTAAPDPVTGRLLVDTFIRPVHQTLNFGASLDTTDPGCVTTYDTALKAGPYPDDTAPIRDAVGGCNAAYRDFADAPNNGWIFALTAFWVGAAGVGALVLTFVVLLWYAVISLAWSCLLLMFRTLWAILPGPSRGPMIRDLTNIAVSLVYITVGTALLPLLVLLIRTALDHSSDLPIFGRFIALDFMLLTAVVLLVVNHVQHRRGATTLAARLSELLRQRATEPGTRLGARVGRWLTQPAYGYGYGPPLPTRPTIRQTTSQPSPYATLHTWERTGGWGGGVAARGMLGRVAHSNGARLLLGGATLAAAAATGGATGLAAGARAATTAAAGTGQNVVHAYHGARTLHAAYRALHAGAERAGTGDPAVDATLSRAAHAHRHLDDRVATLNAATATAAAAAGRLPDVYRNRATGGTASTGNAHLDRLADHAGKVQRRVGRAATTAAVDAALHRSPSRPDRDPADRPDRSTTAPGRAGGPRRAAPLTGLTTGDTPTSPRNTHPGPPPRPARPRRAAPRPDPRPAASLAPTRPDLTRPDLTRPDSDRRPRPHQGDD